MILSGRYHHKGDFGEISLNVKFRPKALVQKQGQKLFTTENTEDTEKTFLLLTAPMALLTK